MRRRTAILGFLLLSACSRHPVDKDLEWCRRAIDLETEPGTYDLQLRECRNLLRGKFLPESAAEVARLKKKCSDPLGGAILTLLLQEIEQETPRYRFTECADAYDALSLNPPGDWASRIDALCCHVPDLDSTDRDPCHAKHKRSE